MLPRNIREQISNHIVRIGGNIDLIISLKRHPAIYRVLRSMFGAVLGGEAINRKIVNGPLKGFRMVLDSRDRNLYLVGQYEKAIADFVWESCRPGIHVFDIGANVGYFSLLLSVLVGSEGHVYSVEPLPQNAEKIREMIRVNKLTNISLFQVAAADKGGVASFQTEPSGAMGHIIKGIIQRSAAVIQVETIRIDDLVRKLGINRIDLAKIDVEGAEPEVVCGMQDVLSRFKPLIICEWHPGKAGSDYESVWQRYGYGACPLSSASLTEPFHVIAKPV